MSIVTTPQFEGEAIHVFLYCFSEKIALTIRYVKKKLNGKYLVKDNELIPYSHLTSNGKI